MTPNDYRANIINMLKGQTPALENIPQDRLDWNGPGAVLELYDSTSGKDRDAFIQALGKIIEEPDQQPVKVVAQALHIATSLDIAQVEPNVQRLQGMPPASDETIGSAIRNYLVFRQLHRPYVRMGL